MQVAPALSVSIYSALATSVLLVHALFILWIIFGAFLAYPHRVLRWLHIISLIWGVLAELLWICPLTLLENWLEAKAGVQPYQGGFLLHYMDKLVYPDLPPAILTAAAIVVCAVNLGFYLRQAWKQRQRRRFDHQ